jgi:hypothetical protein
LETRLVQLDSAIQMELWQVINIYALNLILYYLILLAIVIKFIFFFLILKSGIAFTIFYIDIAIFANIISAWNPKYKIYELHNQYKWH